VKNHYFKLPQKKHMNTKTLFIALVVLASCSTAKLSVPQKFSSQATKFPVKGLNGWAVNQKLAFGPYQTSAIKRGWDFNSSVQYTKFGIRPEEMLLRVFDNDTDKRSLAQRNKFQYTLEDGNGMVEIYATEKFSEKQLVYKSNNPFIGSASKTYRYDYAFTAAIVPLAIKDAAPWSVVLLNRYDMAKDTARRLFDKPYVEQEGYATNGKESIAIRPLHIDNVTTKSGRQTKVIGGKMLSGYELQWEEGGVAVFDLLDNAIWMYNELEPSEKLGLSSVASAIMLKRMQDVQKDKDALAD
jgi:hypothetical protein